ncbi:hypothetical protein EMIHUDRAFT_236900, partial [Emiliania huxleyi CCMP1516]|uniref:Uncharacterized protein n=2 Tax=Emiliania huxleyi TaxID=2903 RepID=A0A0D3JRS1_EMIH1
LGRPVPYAVNPCDYFLDCITPGGDVADVPTFVAAFRDCQWPRVEAEVEEAALSATGKTPLEILELERCWRVAALAHEPRTAGLGAARFGVGYGTQLATLLRRQVRLTLRDPVCIGVNIGCKMVVGILVGLLFFRVWNQQTDFMGLYLGGTLADGAGVDLKINSYVYEQLADGTRLLSLNGTTDEDAHIGRALHATTYFTYALVIMAGLSAIPLLPLTIQDRTIMKAPPRGRGP